MLRWNIEKKQEHDDKVGKECLRRKLYHIKKELAFKTLPYRKC